MEQKYQVFINNHLIQCVDFVEFHQQDINRLSLFDANAEEILALVKLFIREKEQAFTLNLVGVKSNDLISMLKQHLKYIVAAGGVVEHQKQFLVIHRLNKWDLPKGKMEKEENPSLCALREVEEECNVTELKIESSLPSTYHIYEDGDNQLVMKETFWFKMSTKDFGQPKPQKEEGIEEVKWVERSKMNSLVPYTYASLKPLFQEMGS